MNITSRELRGIRFKLPNNEVYVPRHCTCLWPWQIPSTMNVMLERVISLSAFIFLSFSLWLLHAMINIQRSLRDPGRWTVFYWIILIWFIRFKWLVGENGVGWLEEYVGEHLIISAVFWRVAESSRRDIKISLVCSKVPIADLGNSGNEQFCQLLDNQIRFYLSVILCMYWRKDSAEGRKFQGSDSFTCTRCNRVKLKKSQVKSVGQI